MLCSAMLALLMVLGHEGAAQGGYWQKRGNGRSLRPMYLEFGLGTLAYLGDVQRAGPGLGFGMNSSVTGKIGGRFSFMFDGTFGKLIGEKALASNQSIERLNGTLIGGDGSIVFNVIHPANVRVSRFKKANFLSRSTVYIGLGLGASLSSASVFSTVNQETGEIVPEAVVRSARRQFIPNSVLVIGTRFRLKSRMTVGSVASFKPVLSDNLDATDRSGTASDFISFIGFRIGYVLDSKRL